MPIILLTFLHGKNKKQNKTKRKQETRLKYFVLCEKKISERIYLRPFSSLRSDIFTPILKYDGTLCSQGTYKTQCRISRT